MSKRRDFWFVQSSVVVSRVRESKSSRPATFFYSV